MEVIPPKKISILDLLDLPDATKSRYKLLIGFFSLITFQFLPDVETYKVHGVER